MTHYKHKLALVVLIIVHLAAISLIITGLFSKNFQKKEKELLISVEVQRDVDSCGLVRPKVRLKNLIIFLLDAFRDDFFFNYNVMNHTRSLIERGDAVAFRAHTYHPTVTLPRIKSIISGSIPVFSDLIMNFASAQYADENLLSIAKQAGKRIVFYGDNLWLSMFPNSFFEERSKGVHSFYVMDYTEVDNNVTRYLDHETSKIGLESWDILVLHYLGLDHIGHSLTGESPQILTKLYEMDQIIYNLTNNIYRHRQQPGEFAIIVMGDHGMVPSGGHGGNSRYETQVPVIIIKPGLHSTITNTTKLFSKREQRRRNLARNFIEQKTNQVGAAAEVEQIDLTPTILALLDLDKIPENNVGVPFYSWIEPNWRLAASKTLLSVRHFASMLSDTQFPSSPYKDKLLEQLNKCLSQKELQYLCKLVDNERNSAIAKRILSECEITMKSVQRLILQHLFEANQNSNLPFAIILSLISFVGIFLLVFGTTLQNFQLNIYKIVMLQPFCFMSSSFVEEEHEIWFFLFSLFIFAKFFFDCRKFYKSVGKRLFINKFDYFQQLMFQERWLIIILILQRVARLTFETKRRRWILFPNEKVIDVGFDGIIFLPITWLMSVFTDNFKFMLTTIAILIVNTSVLYYNALKIRYHIVPALVGITCVFLIKWFPTYFNGSYFDRIVQCSIIWLFLAKQFSNGILIWLLYVMRTELLHLFFFSWTIGYLLGKIRVESGVDFSIILHTIMSSAFFFTGNTNGVSTIDIVAGYTGLPSYFPVLVGLQILLNVYAGPISVFLGWNQSIQFNNINCCSPKFPDTRFQLSNVINIFLLLRSLSLLIMLICTFYFRFHLMIWTVFMPKMLYEIVHFTIISFFTLIFSY